MPKFSSYDDYVRLQVSKVSRTGQAKKGGLRWEYDVQKKVKPTLVADAAAAQPPAQTKNIIVLGARWGADVQFLREGGYAQADIFAIDLHNPPLSSLVQFGDAHNFSYPDATADLVWAYHVFEHFLKPSSVLQHVRRKCAPRATMFVALPTFGRPDPYDAQDEFKTNEDWLAMCAHAGFEAVRTWSYPIKKKKHPAFFYLFKCSERDKTEAS